MKHLTDAEFVDLVDADAGHRAGPPRESAHGRLPADRLRHVETCDACRTQVDLLRAALAETLTVPPPEPSPLFWDFFSARVSEAIRGESPGRRDTPAGSWWHRRRLAAWATAAPIAIGLTLTIIWRATLHAPVPAGAPSAMIATGADTVADAAGQVPDDIDQDQAWAVVRTAAQDLRWDDVHAAGISLGPGTAEGLALELTAQERAELRRLIDHEIKRRGA
jgi:hypothetical protein